MALTTMLLAREVIPKYERGKTPKVTNTMVDNTMFLVPNLFGRTAEEGAPDAACADPDAHRKVRTRGKNAATILLLFKSPRNLAVALFGKSSGAGNGGMVGGATGSFRFLRAPPRGIK